MIRRPTPAEIADSDAVTRYHAHLNARASAGAGFVVALVLGVLGALLLVHYLVPCDVGHLCWAPILIAGGARPAPRPVVPGRLARCGHRLAIACKRLQVRWLHARQRQLELLAAIQLLRVRRGCTVDSLHYARVLCRQSELRLHLRELHARIAEHVAALQAARPAPSTTDHLGAC